MEPNQDPAATPAPIPQPQAATPAPQEPTQLEGTAAQAQALPESAATAPQEVTDVKPIEITIAMPTQAYFISGIRDFTLNLTQNLTGFSEQWAFRFQAVVDELCNNAIEHGSAAGEMLTVKFISTKGISLEVVVEDTGTASEKMTAAQLTALYQERKQVMTQQYLGFRGRGLPKIVGEWTDELIFEDREGGGMRVRVKKYLRKEDDVVSSESNDPTHIVLQ